MTAMDTEMTTEMALPQAPRQTLAMRLAERNRQRTLRAERLARLRTLGPETAPVPELAEMTGELTGEPAPEMTAEPVSGPAPDPAPDLAPDLAHEGMPETMGPGPVPALAPPAEPMTGTGTVAEMPAAAGKDLRAAREADAALEDFLRALTGEAAPSPAPLPAEPGAILHFQRPAERAEPAAAAAPASAAASGLETLPGAGPGLVWALGRAGLDSLAAIAPLAPAELADRLGPIGRLIPAERWVATARAAMAAPAP